MSFSVELLENCVFLVGPTACGKTSASLCLAEQLGAEIVAMDSMTLYRGMDIGTAKPTTDEQAAVRHHLIDILEPHQEFSLAEYLAAAEIACQELISRGKRPLFVGGAGLYLKGILRGVFAGPAADWDLRQRLEQQASNEGAQSLWNRLQNIDPITAKRLHPNDHRRIIRGIEVFELLGQPLSQLQTQGALPMDVRPRHVYWISPPRDWLYQRIDERVEQMFAQGLLDEVRRLLLQPETLGQTARQGLGYKEVIDWFERNAATAAGNLLPIDGVISHCESDSQGISLVLKLIQTRTRQFAKRQHTWFRNLEEAHPIEISGRESPSEIAATLMRTMSDPATRFH